MRERNHFIIELVVLLVMMALTVFVLWAQYVGLQQTLDITNDDRFELAASDDRSQGGASVGTLIDNGDQHILRCQIERSAYQWPYCTLEFRVLEEVVGAPGIDFNLYDSVTVAAYYDEDNPRSKNASLRFQLRNFNPAYSNLEENPDSLKYSGIEYRPDGKATEISMDNINVYSWWIASHSHLPISLQSAEFQDIRKIEFATGNFMRRATHDIIIDHITFSGPLFDSKLVNRALLYSWLVVVVLLIAARLWNVRVMLSLANARQNELSTINSLLSVKKDELEQIAQRDPLTGALNRGGLESLFDNRLNPKKVALSAIFIDVDHFKRINDNYGHAVGDAVLKDLSSVVSSMTRDTDLFARWGGEEFVLICPNTELANAAMLAEKVRAALEGHTWPADIKLTASFGVAQMNDESFDAFLARADKALYQSKEQGRNRVTIAS
ncbi:GGDEF domain-containing protein [Salinibius halmophilus]|uniref:GGDEF domain-containing protein n=1 Tax=Salinibius halmophilus TaxID=1853216 RepID=UPI000E670854|nr:GGDEF domain-containing protein [Salinibius halmophilus]